MNIFIALQYILQLYANVLFLYTIWKTKSVEGISGKSQLVMAVSYTSRNLDLLNDTMDVTQIAAKMIFIAISYAINLSIFVIFREKYDSYNDDFLMEYLISVCFLFSLFINRGKDFVDLCCCFSSYLEACSIIPQVVFFYNTRNRGNITKNYLFTLALIRLVSVLNWLYSYTIESFIDEIAFGTEILHTIFLYSSIGYYMLSDTNFDNIKMIQGDVGFLVLPNYTQIDNAMLTAGRHVKKVLYIQIVESVFEPFSSKFGSTQKQIKIAPLRNIYRLGYLAYPELDVRVLLSGLKYRDISNIRTNYVIDTIMFEKNYNKDIVDRFVRRIRTVTSKPQIVFLTSVSSSPENLILYKEGLHDHVAVASTFDRLHIGHKTILTEAVSRCSKILTVILLSGVALKFTTLWELTESYDYRKAVILSFLSDICPQIPVYVEKVENDENLLVDDSTLSLIVAQEHYAFEANYINDLRSEKRLNMCEICLVPPYDVKYPTFGEIGILTSGNQRVRVLGSLYRDTKPFTTTPRPYIIILLGKIDAEINTIASFMSEYRNARIISLDDIHLQLYDNNPLIVRKLVELFGPKLLNSNNKINIQTLGHLMYKDTKLYARFYNTVWPLIVENAMNQLRKTSSQIIIFKTSMMFSSPMEEMYHELWVVICSNSYPREHKGRINMFTTVIGSKYNNLDLVKICNVIFCYMKSKRFVKQQVSSAWKLLQARLERRGLY